MEAVRDARWFRRRDGAEPALEVVDELRFPAGGGLRIVEAAWPSGGPERYVVLSSDDEDGSGQADATLGLARWAGRGRALEGRHGTLHPVRTAGWVASLPVERARPLGADQSNTSHVVDERLLVKWLRNLVPGPHPEAEMTGALGAAGFEGMPRSGGAVEYRGRHGEPATVALLAEYVPESESAWEAVDRRLDAGALAEAETIVAAAAVTLAQMHGAAAGAFGWSSTARATCVSGIRAELASREDRPPRVALPQGPERVALTRIHGDVHLAQFLLAGGRCLMIDFEGDPLVALEDRRRPASPMFDLACLRWSISLAMHWRSARGAPVPRRAATRLRERALEAYFSAAPARVRLPSFLLSRWLELFELQKASRELVYARTYLPSWEEIARRGVEELWGSAS